MRKINFKSSPIIVIITFVCSLLLSAATAQVNGQDCSTISDAEIVSLIVDDIKRDSLLAPQMSHIVVGSVNRFVKLQGWTDNKRGYDRLISIVSDGKCAKAINVNNFEETPPPADSPLRPRPDGCAPGTKPCGDVCIPESDSCSDIGKSATDE